MSHRLETGKQIQIEAEKLLEIWASHMSSHGPSSREINGRMDMSFFAQVISPAFQLIYNLVQVRGPGVRSGGWDVTTEEARWQLWLLSSAGIGVLKFEESWTPFLRKPASWLVAVCERSENRGCGGGWLPKGNEISPCPCVERQKTEHFAGLSTARQFADGGVSIPPRSAFLVAGKTMRMYWKIQWNCRRTW